MRPGQLLQAFRWRHIPIAAAFLCILYYCVGTLRLQYHLSSISSISNTPLSRVLSFPCKAPSGHNPAICGTLSLRNWGTNENWWPYTAATGNITIPGGKEVRLECWAEQGFSECLNSMSPNDIQSLLIYYDTNLSSGGFYVLDDDCLNTISLHLTGLRELRLYANNDQSEHHLFEAFGLPKPADLMPHSKITNRGINNLLRCDQLCILHLNADAVDNEGCEILRRFQNLRELELWNTRTDDQCRLRIENSIPGVRVSLLPSDRP